MTYVERHLKVTVYGDAYNSTEQWQFGWKMTRPNPTGETLSAMDSTAQATAGAIEPVISTFWANATSPRFKATHRLQGIKVAVIEPSGLYPEGHIPGEVFKANVPGPASVIEQEQASPQDALCVTLTTARPRGLGSKGRIFLPPMTWTLGADGLIPDLIRDGLVTKLKTLFDGINAAEAGPPNMATFSNGRGTKSFNATTGKIEWTHNEIGPSYPITGFEVGRAVDTQRRRRRKLVESKEGAAITP